MSKSSSIAILGNFSQIMVLTLSIGIWSKWGVSFSQDLSNNVLYSAILLLSSGDVNTVIVSPFNSNADCEKFADPINATLQPFHL